MDAAGRGVTQFPSLYGGGVTYLPAKDITDRSQEQKSMTDCHIYATLSAFKSLILLLNRSQALFLHVADNSVATCLNDYLFG